MKYSIIRNCDKCGKEDNISCISGLIPREQTKILKIVNELINIEIEQENLCGE